jgi:PAS domain S-box-containing protein
VNSVDPAALWHAIFDAYPDAVLVVDADGRIARANHAASALLGYSLDELSRLTVEALVPEATRGRHVADRQRFQHAPRSRPMGTRMDLAARRRDGSQVLVEIALSPLQVEGKAFVLAAIRGVSEYPRVKQALRRARHAECIAQMGRLAVDHPDAQALLAEAPAAAAAALDAQAGALHVLEPDGRLVRSFGQRPAQPVTVVDLAQARAGSGASSLPGFASMLAAPLAERTRVLGVLEVHSRQPRVFDADDQRFLASLVSLLATVVQRGASEAQLRHAQRLESVGQLTGGIAHDFNNLLTVVQGNLQVLDDWPSVAADEGARDLVAAAMRASRRGAELTSKLLAFSRRQMLQPKRVDLAQFVPPLAELLRRTLDARIRIEVAIDADTPACRADPGQLESALVNIAINARDAMPDGGTLSFRARRCDEAPVAVDREAWRGGGVALSVADTGAGMSEAVLARAFEPFFTTKEAGRGTGLGLATVYGFAHQSRGGVALDSRPGQGTTVTLYLPSADEPVSAAAPAPDSGSVTLPAGLSVLLVEDEPEVLRVVQTFLTGWGCQVLACSRVEAALEALRPDGTPFDLLLSDVVLGPGLRGTDIAERARVLRPGLAVLLMSGYAPDAATPVDGGTWPLLRKPFTREQLAQAIAALL